MRDCSEVVWVSVVFAGGVCLGWLEMGLKDKIDMVVFRGETTLSAYSISNHPILRFTLFAGHTTLTLGAVVGLEGHGEC